MKTTFLTTALAAFLGLALAGAPITAKAQTTNTPAATAPEATPKKHKHKDSTSYEGSITAISATSLTVASTKKTLTLAIAPTTKFATLVGKKKTPATAADFAVGDKVTGSFSTDATGAMTAASVHKKATAAAAPAAAPAPAPAATPAAQ